MQANTEASLGELGRHPAAVAVYWDFRSEARAMCPSPSNQHSTGVLESGRKVPRDSVTSGAGMRVVCLKHRCYLRVKGFTGDECHLLECDLRLASFRWTAERSIPSRPAFRPTVLAR